MCLDSIHLIEFEEAVITFPLIGKMIFPQSVILEEKLVNIDRSNFYESAEEIGKIYRYYLIRKNSLSIAHRGMSRIKTRIDGENLT